MTSLNPFAFRASPVTFWTTAVYLALFITLVYIHETVPPAPSDAGNSHGVNLTEAWLDLQNITSAFHPYNSHANDVVRDYYLTRSQAILRRNGIPFSVQDLSSGSQIELSRIESATNGSDQATRPRGVTVFNDNISNGTWMYNPLKVTTSNISPAPARGQYFEGNNLYLYIHGKDDPQGDWWTSQSPYKKARNKGAVLVNCHIDSVSTGYGATDDGMSCVSLLQLLNYFTTEDRQPTHGIVLLFNNAEEDGLFGARAFGYSPLLQFIHTFVNLEGAGAGGRALLFRTTDLEVAQAYSGTPHPFGTVAAANAYKLGLIKSGTDYEVFYDIYGQRGLDIAFYAPRARYHTEEDDTRHASTRSIWHMLSAALASTKRLSDTTGTVFSGDRSDRKQDLVQNGRTTEGVWFDVLGSAWAVFPLRGLFAWSLCLLVAAPLVLLVVTFLLVRKDKYYFFARDIGIHSDVNDDPVRIGGWRGFSRLPLSLIFAGALTVGSAFLVAKINPLIVYSSSYVIWAMYISLFYFALWLIMRGASFVRPSALQRGFVNMWLFALGWGLQVFAAVLEDRTHIGALYWASLFQSAIFLSMLISLLELLGLPSKRNFANMLHDSHQARDRAGISGDNTGTDGCNDNEDEDDGNIDGHGDGANSGLATPTERTPLRAGEQGYGANEQTTFASTYRRTAANLASAAPEDVPGNFPPDAHEQTWSGRLPSWPWIIQFLLLAPVPVFILGNLGLVTSSALSMTGSDGSSFLTPLLAPAVITIILLLPLTPFIHRVTHHVPVFLFVVFVVTLIYNLVAFPFSNSHRFKFNFQQVVDLDKGTNVVTLSGIEKHVRDIISAIPSAAGQDIKCTPTQGRTLMDCSYDASTLPPYLVKNKSLQDLINVTTSKTVDGKTAEILVDALDTRLCYLDISQPIFGFSVEGGGPMDPRFGAFPQDGLHHIDLWRRSWEGAWNVTVQLTEKSSSSALVEAQPEESFSTDELKARAEGKSALDTRADPLRVKVRCAWSDANRPKTIPAFTELKKYMPTWAVVTKKAPGLVEVHKTYNV
ncbi:hypothetical protein S40285_00092 [Stachybotrys chlorohalonatus IBT 40285]|uniref:Peptide hydrolase n=1 Tax=Stachybotrys chlorohalonatus (strain IBT 40285) TaxID=1283841 RepID=A0A084QYY4_STAC4|nr:hypothetical protein S40285_00092 [Stachybotrys chlorohalonata IBT 40285]